MNKNEMHYRGRWITIHRAGTGWRWNIENRAGIVILKGERMFDAPLECFNDAEHEIDKMLAITVTL